MIGCLTRFTVVSFTVTNAGRDATSLTEIVTILIGAMTLMDKPFIHPEIADKFVIEKFAIHFKNPKLTLSQVEMAARQLIWDRQVRETEMLKDKYGLCPGLNVIEDIEDYLQMEEALDEVIENDEDF